MMNSKTLHKGFALVEVMMALVVMGMLLTTLLALQSNSFFRVVGNTARLDRFYPLKVMMVETLKQPLYNDEKRTEKKNADFDLSVTYEQTPVSEASSLGRFKGLYQRKASAAWQYQGKEHSQDLISYGFLPPAVPEKKA